ncbi:MAG: hypothetical protein ACLGIA_07090 [Actinomycetes bacterium]
MDFSSLLSSSTRVLDVGVDHPDLAQELAEQGVERYLGLVVPERLAAVRAKGRVSPRRFQPLESATQAYRNSTDVLILREPLLHRLWTLSTFRHVTYLAVPVSASFAFADAAGALGLGMARRKLEPLGVVHAGGDRLAVFRGRGRRLQGPRRYLSPVWGVEDFVRRVEAAGLEYMALRWFERLPEIEPGEDLDLLVADEDLEKMQQMLDDEPGTIPVDLYSETGLPGADYHTIAYYPPPLARSLLSNAVRHASGCHVPEPLDHLRSLAYHVTYHKGQRSGLPSALLENVEENPEHDYASVLKELGEAVGVDVPLTLDGLDELLDSQGWRPPLDTLRRLSANNVWIRARFLEAEAKPSDEPQVAAFLLRERASTVLTVDEVLRELDHMGFDVLFVRKLDSESRRRCADAARGGNWGRGPFAVSGGDPDTLVVALHHGPRRPKANLAVQYPHLANIDVLLAKRRVRDLVAKRLQPAERFNPMHSSDSEAEAWEYVALAVPEELASLEQEVDERRSGYETDLPVVRQLSRGRRAKVEVVETEQGLAVRKTFATGYLRHMQRELEGMRLLGPDVPAIPELLDSGPNWFSIRYYDNTLRNPWTTGSLVPLRIVRQMLAVLRSIHEHGYAVIDAKPQNFLVDAEHGLKIVDLEFLYRYTGERPAFRNSYTITGPPADYTGDLPYLLSYEQNWLRTTGLSRAGLLSRNPVRQHAERALYRARWGLTARNSPARQWARRSRQNTLDARRALGHRYQDWLRQRASAGDDDVAGRGGPSVDR